MSDFVTELRREVLTAHAQHHVSAARTRRRRRRPVLAGAVALAALCIAAVVLVRSMPQPEQTAEPRVVKVLLIGGNPADGIFAYRSLWVADYARSQVVRIDPSRRRVIARIPLRHSAEDLAVGEGSVWVRGETGDGVTGISRIDPAANRVAADFEARYGGGLAVAAGLLWSPRRNDPTHSLDQLSPATGRLVRETALQQVVGIAAAGGQVWTVGGSGMVARTDARTGEIKHRWPALVPGIAPYGDATEALVADRRGVWLADADAGRLLRLEGDKITRSLRIREPPAIGDTTPILAAAGDDLWLVTRDDPRGSSMDRLDADTGKVTATVDLGKHYPRALVPSRAGLWVVAGDGTVVLVAG